MTVVIKPVGGKYAVGVVDLMTEPNKDNPNAPLGVFARVFYPVASGHAKLVSYLFY